MIQAIWRRRCKVRCPSVIILAVAVLFVEEVPLEVAIEVDKDVEDSLSTEARILKVINHLVVVKILEAEEDVDFNEESLARVNEIRKEFLICIELRIVNGDEEGKKTIWYLDSGASNHMSDHKDLFTEIDETVTGEVTFGDSSKIPVKEKRTITIMTKNGNKKYINDVYYIPALKSNIISLGQLVEKRYNIQMQDNSLTIRNQVRELIANVEMSKNRLFTLNMQIKVQKCLKSVIKNDSWLWHLRYGHLGFSGLKLLSKTKMVNSLPEINKSENLCEMCVKGKQHSQSFPGGKSWRANRLLEIVHTYIIGHFDVASHGGNRWSEEERKVAGLFFQDDDNDDDSNTEDDGDDDPTPPQSSTQQTPINYNHLKLDNFTSFKSDTGSKSRIERFRVGDVMNKDYVQPSSTIGREHQTGSIVRITGQPYEIKKGNALTTPHNEKVYPAGQVGENIAPQQSCSRPCVPVPNDSSSLTEIEVSKSNTLNPIVDLTTSTTFGSSGCFTTPSNNSMKGKFCHAILSKTPIWMLGAARQPLRNISNEMTDHRGTTTVVNPLTEKRISQSVTASLTSVKESSYVTPTCITDTRFDSVFSTEKELPLKGADTSSRISEDKAPTVRKKYRRRVRPEVVLESSSQLFHPKSLNVDDCIEHSSIATFLEDGGDDLFNEDGFDYDFNGCDEDNVIPGYCSLGPPNVLCEKCNAVIWKEECVNKNVKHGKPEFSLCCSKGQISLPKTPPTPSYLM
ncbi:hypothetical protein AgCh_027504 [Apium graveolens]